MMKVLAVSAETRDRCLTLWPQHPARRKTAVIVNYPLIDWHPFPRIHVGLATYFELHQWITEEYDEYSIWCERNLPSWDLQECERNWWGSVLELQKCVAGKR